MRANEASLTFRRSLKTSRRPKITTSSFPLKTRNCNFWPTRILRTVILKLWAMVPWRSKANGPVGQESYQLKTFLSNDQLNHCFRRPSGGWGGLSSLRIWLEHSCVCIGNVQVWPPPGPHGLGIWIIKTVCPNPWLRRCNLLFIINQQVSKELHFYCVIPWLWNSKFNYMTNKIRWKSCAIEHAHLSHEIWILLPIFKKHRSFISPCRLRKFSTTVRNYYSKTTLGHGLSQKWH